MPDGPPSTLRLLLRPSMFLLHVPAVLAVVAAMMFGNWQLGVWQEHREDRSAEIAAADPVPLADVMGPDDPFPAAGLGRPVIAPGQWVPGSTAYVADKVEDGATGYWVVTLLATCGTTADGCPEPAALAVVRGWAEETLSTADPPEPTGPVEVQGWLQPGEAAGEPDPDPTDDVLPTLRIAELLQRGDQDLYGAYLMLDDPATARAGLVAVTPDSLPDPPTFTGLRNLLYGIEWYVFAGFAVFLWWRWTRDELHRARAAAAGAPRDEAPVDQPDEPLEGAEPADAPVRLPSTP